ncbi:MAG TPA: glycosyl hydrolase family 5, partial [Candidatus Dormibacteraeota bacterium]|nr:glycosyl hydrolase family 5 [Candidatus Dormibacteraeota bacterium]
KIQWSNLYDEARLVTHIMQVWREDGVPPEVPLFITESNISPQYSEAYQDLWSALWLADYVGAFLAGGGNALYYFHYMPAPFAPGHNGSPGTFSFFSADSELRIKQPLAQYFASRLINLEWLQPGNAVHRLFSASAHISDAAGPALVSAYPVLRPDGAWGLMIVNKDQDNAHQVEVRFEDSVHRRRGGFSGPVHAAVCGPTQYRWHPDASGGRADPDGPVAMATLAARPGERFTLPAASITVLVGKVTLQDAR